GARGESHLSPGAPTLLHFPPLTSATPLSNRVNPNIAAGHQWWRRVEGPGPPRAESTASLPPGRTLRRCAASPRPRTTPGAGGGGAKWGNPARGARRAVTVLSPTLVPASDEGVPHGPRSAHGRRDRLRGDGRVTYPQRDGVGHLGAARPGAADRC